MVQSAGTMLGPYRIVRLIGAGGMGEVYAATDTRLDRTVAVKVLPSELASDSDRLQRFEREARAVSSLTHPHIATLFDVGEQGGTHYLVMELVEGRTLADQLARGKLRVSVALQYAAQIADALDNAHRKGIIHRDLKPGNVMITSTGVKLLDFGLAKLGEEQRPGRGAHAATQAREPITAEGAVLGTVQYMAPEQLEGEEVDARADIFSFGCVLYEMLSGKPPFEGNSAAGLTAAILRSEPQPLSAQSEVPAVLDHLVAMCLAKNRNDRWQTAHDVSKQLEWIRSSLGSLSGVSLPATRPRSRKPFWIGAAVAIVVVAAAAFFVVHVPRSSAPAQLMRFTVSFRDQVHYSIGEDFFRSASISPDGQRIVFTGADQATGTAALYIRPIGSEQVTVIRGSEDGTEPFWSPDSKSVGFYARGKVKIANLDEGTTRDLADAASTGGATWNDAGEILISLANPAPIMMVPAAGGTPKAATTLESGDGDHDWPQFLADGTHFLYAVRGATAFSNKVYLTSLGSSSRTLLVEDVSAFAYAAPNHLLYVPRAGGKLLARTLDVSKAALTGPPVTLAENALAPFSASRTGALTYRTVPSTPNPLVWIKPDGTVIGDALPPGYYTDPVISPDGTQVALATKDNADARYDVSVLDLATGTLRKLTPNTAGNRAPVWSPDGKSIVFLSFRPEAPGLYRKDASGIGAEELVLRSKGVLWPYQWTRDALLYFEGVSGANDIWMMSTNDLSQRTPLIQTPYNDVDGAVSPDGKWLAYVTNETGRWEIYLTTFPPSATKIVVTTIGGCDPTWSPDGATLYFTRPSSAELLSMPVTSGDPPRFGSPRRIYAGPLEYPSDHSIDVDPKGDRVLVAPSFAVQGDLTVLVNWESALAK